MVPEPIEKCAVCAASPSRINLSCAQRSHLIRLNWSHAALPLQMRGVGHQAVAVEIFGKNPLARGDRIGLAQRVEGEPSPGRVRAFDDEGRAVGREFIGVGPDPSGLGLLERESEGVERLGRAEPGEAVGAGFGIDPEMLGIMVAKAAVDAVGADDEVVFGPMLEAGFAFAFEVKFDAQFAGALAEDREQALAADADETVPGGAHRVAVNMDLDIVPMGEFVGDDLRRCGVVGGEILDRLVREDDAPAERFALAIALEHFACRATRRAASSRSRNRARRDRRRSLQFS